MSEDPHGEREGMVKKLSICMLLASGVACQPEAVDQRSGVKAKSTDQNSTRTSGSQQGSGGNATNAASGPPLSTLDWDGFSPLTSGQFRFLEIE